MNKEKMLEYAKKHYPDGTHFISAYSGKKGISNGKFSFHRDGDLHDTTFEERVIYHKKIDKWADIIYSPNININYDAY